MKYPTIKWIKQQLRYCYIRKQVLAAYIVGSEAKGTARANSDFDIAVVIPPVYGKSSLKYSELFHSKLNQTEVKWNDRTVDFQFFYPTDTELETYSKIPLV